MPNKTHKMFSLLFWANSDALTTKTFTIQSVRWPPIAITLRIARSNPTRFSFSFRPIQATHVWHVPQPFNRLFRFRCIRETSANHLHLSRYCWRKWRVQCVNKYAHNVYFCLQLNRWTSDCHLLDVNVQRQRLYSVPDGIIKFQWITIIICVAFAVAVRNETVHKSLNACMRTGKQLTSNLCD